MQIFATTVISTLLLASIVNGADSDCTSSGNTCTLAMYWPKGSKLLAADAMEKPNIVKLFSKDCTAFSNIKMDQPDAKGPITITADKLANKLTVHGMDGFERPLFKYGDKENNNERCGAGQGPDGGTSMSCAFDCEGVNAPWWKDPALVPATCFGGGNCTLFMEWSAGSPGLKSGAMALPKRLDLYGGDCKHIKTTMKQPEANGPIDIESSLKPIKLTGQRPGNFSQPLFTYDGQDRGGEHCGAGTDYWKCNFAC